MERYLRQWQEDAASKQQYETAIYAGDKVLALTNSDQDALRLAQLHFANGTFRRAQSLLARHGLEMKNAEYKYLAAHCHIKQGHTEEALEILGEKTPAHLLQALHHSRPKLVAGDIHARHGTNKHGKIPTRRDRSTSPVKNADKDEDTNRRFEAGMCYLRGVCFAKLTAYDRAKAAYMDAVRIDVQCFEAFDQLMRNALLTPSEEWEFLDSLNFDSITASNNVDTSQQAASLTRMLYTTRLSKYSRPREFDNAMSTLSTHYNLSSNPDILLAKAELLFTQCRFKQALNLTSSILSQDRHNLSPLPIHLACLHELQEKNALQLLAHDLTATHPDSPHTWLAVGVYYLTISNIAAARRFFAKSSEMDPQFGPAWIGFAHTFAAEGEHEQAISAYSTAMRLFQGTHLPSLFLGMQYLQNNNIHTAGHFLREAETACSTDPLLLNELGVVAYHEEDLLRAIRYFDASLDCADAQGAEPRSTLSTRINLGHAHRRAGGACEIRAAAASNRQNHNGEDPAALADRARAHCGEALEQFNEVLRSGGRDAAVFSAKGLVLLELGDPKEAVVALHESLAVNPVDGVANELLARALEECARAPEVGTAGGWWGDAVEETGDGMVSAVEGAAFALEDPSTAHGFDRADAWVESRKKEILDRVGSGARRRKPDRAEEKKKARAIPASAPTGGKGKGRAGARQPLPPNIGSRAVNGNVGPANATNGTNGNGDFMETDEEML